MCIMTVILDKQGEYSEKQENAMVSTPENYH